MTSQAKRPAQKAEKSVSFLTPDPQRGTLEYMQANRLVSSAGQVAAYLRGEMGLWHLTKRMPGAGWMAVELEATARRSACKLEEFRMTVC